MPYKDSEKQKLYLKKHYEDNKNLYKERSAKSRYKTQELVDSLKRGQKCADCKLEWPSYVLDFHHTNRDNKITNIGRLTHHVGRDKIIREINKCILLCANCHRIRTHGPIV